MPLLLDQLDLMNQFKNEAIYSHVLTLNLRIAPSRPCCAMSSATLSNRLFCTWTFRVIADRKLRAHAAALRQRNHRARRQAAGRRDQPLADRNRNRMPAWGFAGIH
ncbi:MAG: hypothetical protein R3F44_14780 [Candidatus Competibacteraceae bacterium]